MTIKATEVPFQNRLSCLKRLFGCHSFRGGKIVHGLACMYLENYQSNVWQCDSWRYYNLSCGGGYMAPITDKNFTMHVHDNRFNGVLSADAAGIALTLCTLNYFIWKAYENGDYKLNHWLTERKKWLKDYANQHSESEKIFRAVD
ncbi:antirestriction protein [Xenorhabdus bovienii]|uniref:antirestriction protein n=1 Tax=Xenorhabdus bovienii TaxID=40576 RepID=UPI0023B237DC|nr:antirestriction protein [Xenorhabdus bovienii]MDE9429914.1 antirestriction protein [Xenorhabdus bovienii]MDE9487494.1 antirestriction protein [Xenorhabdus bovienii]